MEIVKKMMGASLQAKAVPGMRLSPGTPMSACPSVKAAQPAARPHALQSKQVRSACPAGDHTHLALTTLSNRRSHS